LVARFEGSLNLVNFWPDNIDKVACHAFEVKSRVSGLDAEPARWLWDGDELKHIIEVLHTSEIWKAPNLEAITAEGNRLRAIVDAVSQQIAQFQHDARRQSVGMVEDLRADHERLTRAFSEIPLPDYQPPDIRFELEEDSDCGPSPTSPIKLPPRLTVRDGDWDQFVEVVRRWCSVVERNPSSFISLTENSLRDLLLATLHSVYPVALGEVMTAGRKSDIYVVADPDKPELRPIIAELKIWNSASKAKAGVKQHLEQLTVRETRGALVFFIKGRDHERPRSSLHNAIAGSPGFDRWTTAPATDNWPVARFRSTHIHPRHVQVTVGDVFLERSE
jgi:hypothetical protein